MNRFKFEVLFSIAFLGAGMALFLVGTWLKEGRL